MSWNKSLRNTLRLTQIGWTLARHDALFIFARLGAANPLLWTLQLVAKKSSLPEGVKLANALQALGPAYIKLGQMLATRPDIVGNELATGLAELQDNLPPFPGVIARSIIEAQLGKPLHECFSSFEETPVAAASIAQVHRATSLDGKAVAVKVLRPGITAAFMRDTDLFYWIAELIETRLPRWRRLKPIEVVNTFKASVAMELDLRFEAAAATEMASNIQADSGFRVPAIDWDMTAEQVMVMEWVEGISISNLAALQAAGHDLNQLLCKLSENFFKHAFRDGFFHADMHPGNLFVDSTGTIVAVDFGIMGRLDENSRMYVAEILRAFLREDYKRVAEVHFRAGYVPYSQSVEDFALACMAIAKPILDRPLHEISIGRLLGQLFKITETFQMETQPQLLLLQKTLVVVEGVGRMLNPGVNMWEMARQPIEDWATHQFSPQARIKQAARKGKTFAEDLPQLIQRAERALEVWSDPKGIKLHPDSLIHVQVHARKTKRDWLLLGWAALIVTAVLIFVKA